MSVLGWLGFEHPPSGSTLDGVERDLAEMESALCAISQSLRAIDTQEGEPRLAAEIDLGGETQYQQPARV